MTDAPFPFSILSPFSQTIGKFVNNPITDWSQFYSPHVIFNFNPQDAPIETHVLSKVGSYGKQLSIVVSALDVLRRKMPVTDLTDADEKALKAFDTLSRDAQTAVDQYRGKMSADDIVAAAEAFARRAPHGIDHLRARLDTALDGQE